MFVIMTTFSNVASPQSDLNVRKFLTEGLSNLRPEILWT